MPTSVSVIISAVHFTNAGRPQVNFPNPKITVSSMTVRAAAS